VSRENCVKFLCIHVYLQGTSFGYHAGGWGKPPVDENGKPLYGDVFGTQGSDFQVRNKGTCKKQTNTRMLYNLVSHILEHCQI